MSRNRRWAASSSRPYPGSSPSARARRARSSVDLGDVNAHAVRSDRRQRLVQLATHRPLVSRIELGQETRGRAEGELAPRSPSCRTVRPHRSPLSHSHGPRRCHPADQRPGPDGEQQWHVGEGDAPVPGDGQGLVHHPDRLAPFAPVAVADGDPFPLRRSATRARRPLRPLDAPGGRGAAAASGSAPAQSAKIAQWRWAHAWLSKSPSSPAISIARSTPTRPSSSRPEWGANCAEVHAALGVRRRDDHPRGRWSGPHR